MILSLISCFSNGSSQSHHPGCMVKETAVCLTIQDVWWETVSSLSSSHHTGCMVRERHSILSWNRKSMIKSLSRQMNIKLWKNAYMTLSQKLDDIKKFFIWSENKRKFLFHQDSSKYRCIFTKFGIYQGKDLLPTAWSLIQYMWLIGKTSRQT